MRKDSETLDDILRLSSNECKMELPKNTKVKTMRIEYMTQLGYFSILPIVDGLYNELQKINISD